MTIIAATSAHGLRHVQMSGIRVSAFVCHHGLMDEQITPILRADNSEAAVAWYAWLGWLIPTAVGAPLIELLAHRACTANVTIPTVVSDEVAP